MSRKVKSEQVKTWEKTNIPGLLLHRSGIFYARVFKGGREKWQCLDTKLKTIAQEKFAHLAGELKAEAKAKARVREGKMMAADAIKLFENIVNAGWTLRGRGSRTRKKAAPRSIQYRLRTIGNMKRTWPGLTWLDTAKMEREARVEALKRRDDELARTPIKSLTGEMCEEWGTRYSKMVSPPVFNNTLDTLRYICDTAVRAHGLIKNPALNVGRCSVKSKNLNLPSRAQFAAFVDIIRTAGSRNSKNCADHVEFLAYTGARLNEAKHVEWRDADFADGVIVLRITKNGEVRRVPMIAAAGSLLERMRRERPDESLDQRVLRVRESQKSMDRAAKKVGFDRITHHDLRHLFATIVIESGVDIPTLSRWLGHKDGGVLAMKTYGHLRDEHSKAAARKVTFEPLPETATIIPFKPAAEA
jgi:integrase